MCHGGVASIAQTEAGLCYPQVGFLGLIPILFHVTIVNGWPLRGELYALFGRGMRNGVVYSLWRYRTGMHFWIALDFEIKVIMPS